MNLFGTPRWATVMQQTLQQISQQLGKLVSEDAAIEAQVTILQQDVTQLGTQGTALQTAFNNLEAEVAAGGAPSAQTMTDLANVVSAVTTAIGALPTGPTPPPAPAPTPAPSS